MVLEGTGSVYDDNGWYLVSISWYCLILGGTCSAKGFYACIYWKKWRFDRVTPMPHRQTSEYRATQLLSSIKHKLSHANTFWINDQDFVLNLILNWIILKPDSIFKTDRLPLVHYDRTWVMFHNLNANALCSKSNGSYDIKDFETLPLIFSTSKYSRWKFQPCPSFYLRPNIPDK